MIRVYISSDPVTFGSRIFIMNEFAGDASTPPQRLVLRLTEGRANWEQTEPLAAIEPTLTLDDDAGRALLDELTRYYHGADDTRALRRDYDAERSRVDKLTDSVSLLAHTLAGVAAQP